MNKNKLIYLLLGLALLLSAFFRLYKNTDLIIVKSDVGEDALPVWELMHEGKIMFTGPPTSLGKQFPTGPFYYYILAPIYNLANWDPARVSLILKILSLSNIIFFYLVVSKFFGRTAGVLAAFFDALSYRGLMIYRWLANPMPLMTFGLLFTWSLLEIITNPKQKNWWLVAFLTAGLSLHLESASALWYLPVLAMLSLSRRLWPGLKTYLLSLLLFGATFLPQLIFELQNNFSIIRTLQGYLVSQSAFSLTGADLLTNLKELIYAWSFLLLRISSSWSILPALITLPVFWLLSPKKSKPLLSVLGLMLLVPTLGFAFYRFEFLDYYLTGFYPALTILTAVFVALLWAYRGIFGKVAAVLITALIVGNNVSQISWFLKQNQNPFFEVSYRQELKAVDWVIDKAGGSRFAVKAYRAHPTQDWTTQVDEYLYLAKWQASIKCPELNCQYVEEAGEAEAVFLIYEDDVIHPQALIQWLSENQPAGELVEKVRLKGITIEHRVKDGSVVGFQLKLQPFREELEKKGIEATYEHYKEVYYSLDPGSRHYVGHFLGEEAYRLAGLEGLSVCDASFDYGCVHGYILAGVQSEGEPFLTKAFAKCRQFSNEREQNACIHGISHILLYAKGYAFDDLTDALGECDAYFAESHPQNCYSAVFMEFNLRSLGNDETGELVTARELDGQGFQYPCNKLSNKYQWTCYSESGSWWSYSLREGNDIADSDFIKMLELCQEAQTIEGKDGCYWGVGRIMADVYHYEPEKVRQMCQKSGDEDAIFSCIEGALIVSLDNKADKAYQLCEAVRADRYQECLDKGKSIQRPVNLVR